MLFVGDMFGGHSPTEVGVIGIQDSFAAELAQKLGVAAAAGASEPRVAGNSIFIILHEKYACFYPTLEVCLSLSCERSMHVIILWVCKHAALIHITPSFSV
jgi:hypothetical protein